MFAVKSTAVRIIAYGSLRQFGEDHPQVMSSISAWYKIARSKSMVWRKPQDVVNAFGASRVDILRKDRVCIDIGGSSVRLILKVEYGHGIAFVRWIGWHKDYDQLGDRIHSI